MKNRKYTILKLLLAISCQLLAICAIAQVQPSQDTLKAITTPVPPAPDSSIHVYGPAVILNTDNKLYQYQRYNHGTSSGFRVQIDFGQEKNAVYKTQSDFQDKYPGMPSYVSYKQPYFRVSAGDFRTKLEAVCFLNKVKKDYPAAFVVADKIVPPPLQ